MELYNNIANVLSKKGINLIVGTIYDLMAICKEWYRGNVNDFHYYTERVNGTNVECERLTMNMPKKLCEDITKLLWTEKTKIELSSVKATNKLWEVLDSKENSFTENFPVFLEKAMLALGNGATIEYKDKNNKTIIDYVDGDVIIPYKFTNSYIYGMVTISRFVEGSGKTKTFYTHITYHEYVDGVYIKHNELYKAKTDSELGKEIKFESMFPSIKETEIQRTATPYFQIFKPNLANNFDTNSPMGISILANSIDRFKALDIKYDSFNNEFILGKKRIVVDQSAMKGKMETDSDGNPYFVQYFDKNDKIYQALNIDSDKMKEPVKEIDMKIRYQEHIDSINAELSWLADNVGLGDNYYEFDGTSVKTATEVISENSKAFRTREHYLAIVKSAVYDLVKAVCELEGIKTTKISIIPDDSIIEDKNAETIRAQMEVSQSLRSKKSYLMDIKGMTEEEADKELELIKNEKMSSQEALGIISEE
ncbi:MAG: hypothetical protein IJH39_11600 [Clostridia bacterium]|nr:hypothetical protein [Clostridia bacterium]